MILPRTITLWVLCFACACLGHAADYVPGELTVGYFAETSPEQKTAVERNHHLRLLADYGHIHAARYAIEDGQSVEAKVAAVKQVPGVRYAEPVWVRKASGYTGVGEPRFAEQWYLHNTGGVVNQIRGTSDMDINWPEAMEIYKPKIDPIVAVVDSGIAMLHPEFVDTADKMVNLYVNRSELDDGKNVNGIDDDGNGFIDDFCGWDFVDGDNNVSDENGHGTVCAFEIAGLAGNKDGGVGVCPNAKILPMRILDSMARGGSWIDAASYAYHRGARIFNFSLGGAPYSLSEQDMITWLSDKGCLIVAAAGNGDQNGKSVDNDLKPYYPASYDGNVISVAALDADGRLAYFSNYGTQSVHVAAPGVNIFAADLSRADRYVLDLDADGWTTGANPGNASPYRWSMFTDPDGDWWLTDRPQPLSTNVVDGTDTWAKSPLIDLVGVNGPTLELELVHDLPRFGAYGGAALEIQVADSANPNIWKTEAVIWGRTGVDEYDNLNLRLVDVDLSGYSGLKVYVRLRVVADGVVCNGVGVWSFTIRTRLNILNYDGNQYKYTQGTSMAAPIVAGIAALVHAQRPDLEARDWMQIIVGTVSNKNNNLALAQLEDKVMFPGIVDARRALEIANIYQRHLARIYEESTAAKNNWYGTSWFGWLQSDRILTDPWVYHLEHGWMYTMDAGGRNFYGYTQKLGWIYINKDYYPYIYSFKYGAYLLYSKGTGGVWFYNTNTKAWLKLL